MTKITFFKAFARKYPKESKYILKHIKEFNGGKEVDFSDFKKVFLYNLVNYLDSKVSPNSVRLYCSYIKAVLNMYSDEYNVPCKDYSSILSTQKTGVLNIYLTNDEIKKLIAYTPVNEVEHTVRNQFALSCLTGMRHSDVIHLNNSNINGNEIVYVSKKTKNVVRTFNSPIVEEFIAQGMIKIYSDMVFNDTIRAICKTIGLNGIVSVVKAGARLTGEKWQFITSHTARRSFCTNVYLHTKDIVLVSSLAGHTNINVTQRYICINDRQDEKMISYFSQFKTEVCKSAY